MCERKPALRKINGCDAPPVISGRESVFSYPPGSHKPRATIDCCPLKIITHDTHDLFAALSLADGKITIADQQHLPPPYLDALSIARFEQGEKMMHKAGGDD